MHNFLVHSNESACRKSGRLGMEQVFNKNSFHPTEFYIGVCQLLCQPGLTCEACGYTLSIVCHIKFGLLCLTPTWNAPCK